MGLAVGYMAYDKSPDAADIGWYDPDVENINGYVMLIMLILGIIIGITSITAKEVTPFLIATIALVVAATANVGSTGQNSSTTRLLVHRNPMVYRSFRSSSRRHNLNQSCPRHGEREIEQISHTFFFYLKQSVRFSFKM